MSTSPKRLAVLASAAVVAAGLTVCAPPAQAASTGLIITEVYGNGGNSGANLNADYVELYNASGSEISLSGKSLQYRSATGTGNANGAVALSGTVPSHEHYLVQVSAATTNGS